MLNKIYKILFIVETIQTNPQLFMDGLNVPNTPLPHLRRMSEISLQSTMSGLIDNVPFQAVSAGKHWRKF